MMTTTSFVCAMENRALGSGDRTRCSAQCEHCVRSDPGGCAASLGETHSTPDYAALVQQLEDAPVAGGRDPVFEREFLAGAEKIAGVGNGFAQRVADRLLRSERLYGYESYRNLSIVRILKEIHEEALDLGGWSVLAALLAEAELDNTCVIEARMILQEIAAHGAKADGLLSELKRLVDEAR